jgi:hypothetical protein
LPIATEVFLPSTPRLRVNSLLEEGYLLFIAPACPEFSKGILFTLSLEWAAVVRVAAKVRIAGKIAALRLSSWRDEAQLIASSGLRSLGIHSIDYCGCCGDGCEDGGCGSSGGTGWPPNGLEPEP